MYNKRVSSHLVNMLAGHHLNSVSTFTGWLFRLQHQSNASSQSAGKEGERDVKNAKFEYPKPRYARDEWEPLFIDDLSGKQPGEKISSLTFNGTPMLGKPDYVFLSRQKRIAIVVEIKTSNANLEADGWPNLRAQLWAYAQLDIIREAADKVILIGEIWGKTAKGGVTLVRTYCWDFPNEHFDSANRQLFDLYKEYASC